MRTELAFVRENGRWLTAGFLLTLFSSFGQTFFIGLFGNDLRRSFDLTAGGFGGIYMIATLLSAASLPWLGRTLDIMSGRKVAGFTIPALAFACILIGTVQGLVGLTVAIFLLRLFGQGMMTEIAFTEVGRWFEANRGRAMALVTPGFQVGNAILPVVAVWIAEMAGWRQMWLASALLLALVAWPVLTALLRVERVPAATRTVQPQARTARAWTRAEVMGDPVLYILLAGTLAPPFIGTTIFFHQGHLVELRGYDSLVFASAFPVMAATTVLFGFLCGYLIDRFGALRILPFFLLPLALASVTGGLVTPAWGIYLFMLLLGVSNGFTQTLLGALWPEVYGTANLGGIRAITVSAMVLATALGPGITGALIDAGIDLPRQMIWMGIWCLMGCAALAFAASLVRRREST
ncbi:MFS transporter [Pelagerythrobacter rhizovicinus]|uniref:MFS transporter n=1 Tax=Pelagerythrobacter rhizovicinus TaxID=2268576 RepID=A0A4Q2KL97_9SPHN|nr:MFS transporter [Pelagerythrobacter rhizovicinus]RXZ66068.1 MFS transporter [Pelagerythrobacter rhizovicinus]